MSFRDLTGDVARLASPLFAGLSDEVRELVSESFEPVSFAFGAVIVREGDEADGIYLLAEGTASVVKQGLRGDEVLLDSLRPGSWFGETALLEQTTRPATVRASSPVVALRLDETLFLALTGSHPQIRSAFEALSRQRSLWNFFRIHSSFAELPPDALARLIASLEPVKVTAGEVVSRQGDPAGPMHVIERGRLRAFTTEDGRERDVEYLRAGDFFGELSLFRDQPRAASVAAVTDADLLRLDRQPFQTLLDEQPDFRRRIEERTAQHDFRRLARVPLDFADEILPAAVDVERHAGESRAELFPQPAAVAFESGPKPAIRRKYLRRFPHLYQLDEADCGAACLAMVCRYFGKEIPVTRIRDVVNTSTDGTSLGGIARGATELGLDARAVRASKSNLGELPLPAIVHWEGNHWLVLYEVSDKSVRVADPATGLRRIDRAEFLEHWSGYTALVAHSERFEQTEERRSNIAWLGAFFSPHRRALAAAVALAVVAAGLELVLPIMTQTVVDRVLPHHDLGLLWIVIGALAAVLVAITGATLVQRYLLANVAVQVDSDSLDFMTARLLDLPMSYFTTRRTGDIERRLAGLREVRQFVVGSGVLALTAVTQLLAALALMFFYSWVLALVFLATIPLYWFLLRISSQRLRPMYESLEEVYGKYTSNQIDAIKGIETVKTLAAERALRELMLTQFQSLARRLFQTQFLVMAYQGGMQLLGFLSFALFLSVGAVEVVHGHLSIGRFVAYNALVALANGPVLVLVSLWNDLQVTKILIGRLDDVLEQEPEQGHDHSALRTVSTLEGDIELVAVGFRYGSPEAPAILEGITVRVEAGQTIAIVGRSGSGKTTLVKLLAGLLEPTSGTIRYDGLDLKTLDYRTLRRQIGVVLQESYLFDDTIARNIAFGEERPDLDQVVWAARAASAHDFVRRLPMGYETRVGESGIQLSGGQRQRIAIARALYHRPPVLLFDEATSSLDTESERAVKESMDELLEGRTSFVIAHRLSTIRDADRILVLERGKLVEDGSHDELIAGRGLYYYLASQQLGI